MPRVNFPRTGWQRVKRPTKKARAKAANKGKQASNKEKHEGSFVALWRSLCRDLPEPVREHRFHAERRWRFDLAWPSAMMAVELHGGGNRGRHNTVSGMAKDLEKANAAVAAGWRVLAFNVIRLRDMPSVVAEVAELLRAMMEGK